MERALASTPLAGHELSAGQGRGGQGGTPRAGIGVNWPNARAPVA